MCEEEGVSRLVNSKVSHCSTGRISFSATHIYVHLYTSVTKYESAVNVQLVFHNIVSGRFVQKIKREGHKLQKLGYVGSVHIVYLILKKVD